MNRKAMVIFTTSLAPNINMSPPLSNAQEKTKTKQKCAINT